jgi:hypothetical protein
VRRGADLPCYIAAFSTLGYEPCGSGMCEEGYEKLAIYVDNDGFPIHMARQLLNGEWSSKLGTWIDITHELDGLTGTPTESGTPYGSIAQFLRRSRSHATKET